MDTHLVSFSTMAGKDNSKKRKQATEPPKKKGRAKTGPAKGKSSEARGDGSSRSSSEKENGKKKSPPSSNGASKKGSSQELSVPAGQAVTPLVTTSQKAMEQASRTSTRQPMVSLKPFAVTTSGSNKRIVPSVVETGRDGSNQDGAEVETASIITDTNQSGLYTDEKETPEDKKKRKMADLKNYVWTKLFPYWKFFNSPKQMMFSSQKGCIVRKICIDNHVNEKLHLPWWENNKEAILSTLNRKRSDVTGYIKSRFIGK